MERDLALRSARHALDRAEVLLGRAEAAGLLDARLAPDMMPLADQIGIVASFARRAVLPLVGTVPGPLHIPSDAPGLRALLRAARAEIDAADGPPAPTVEHVAGEARLSQAPEDYLARFALPNLWFHLSMAHAMLRANGVPVGKADFDGLHRYPAPPDA